MATDTTLDKFLTYGTHADRLAFVPVPPANILVEFYETDTGDVFVWYSGAWFQIGGTGSTGGGSTTVTLVDADIKALPTTNVTLVAAPGVGKIIIPTKLTLILKSGATAYTNISPDAYIAGIINGNGNVTGYLGNSSTIASFTFVSDLLTSTTGALANIYCPYADDRGSFEGWGLTTDVSNTTTLANQALNLYMVNAALGNLTGGNAGNRLMVITDYKLVTLP